jgi:uncharacterized protein DUF3626
MTGHPERARLSPSQAAALRHVERLIQAEEPAARHRVDRILRGAGIHPEAYEHALECVRGQARIALHFHPDRISSISTAAVVNGLLADGVYRNQFETGLSSGSVSAHPGGARDDWERMLFGGAYHAPGVRASERPKYGALELVRFPDGPIPRFGSCYFVLRPGVSERTTFTFMGSEDGRAAQRIGTIQRMDTVLAPLMEEIEQGGTTAPPWPPYRAPTLGVPDLTVNRLLRRCDQLIENRRDVADANPGRVLDTQIEAQVHGPVSLDQDVEWLVADPAFSETGTGTLLRALSERYCFPLRWHCGFRLTLDAVPDDFRGPAMPSLARRVADGSGSIDAAAIGRAQVSLGQRPGEWVAWGNEAEVLQLLKQLWHVVVHYGSPAGPISG